MENNIKNISKHTSSLILKTSYLFIIMHYILLMYNYMRSIQGQLIFRSKEFLFQDITHEYIYVHENKYPCKSTITLGFIYIYGIKMFQIK